MLYQCLNVERGGMLGEKKRVVYSELGFCGFSKGEKKKKIVGLFRAG